MNDISVLEKEMIKKRDKVINKGEEIEIPQNNDIYHVDIVTDNLIKLFYIILKDIKYSSYISFFTEDYKRRIEFPYSVDVNGINIQRMDITEIPRYGTFCTELDMSIRYHNLIYGISNDEFEKLYRAAKNRKSELIRQEMFKEIYPKILKAINDENN